MSGTEEIPFPTVQWTAVNRLPQRSSTAVEATSEARQGSDDNQNTLTDDDILTGDPTLIDGERLLQVAATHTNQEIIEKVNTHNDKAVLSDRSMTVRLTRVISRVAKKQGRSRDQVKAELDKLRKQNGVFKRKNAMMGNRSKAAKAAKAAQKAKLQQLILNGGAHEAEQKEVGDDDDDEDEDKEDLLTNLETAIEEKRVKDALLAECESILKDDSSLLCNDRLFKVASVFTNAEIVKKVNAGHETPIFTSRLLSDRLAKAIDRKAENEGKERKDVKAELEANRRANGVTDRKNAHASAMRAASMAAKKDQKTTSGDVGDMSEGEDQDDYELDGEDPLGDLEELGRREPDFVLEQQENEDHLATRKTPLPFDGSRVGYLADSDTEYVAGFRVC